MSQRESAAVVAPRAGGISLPVRQESRGPRDWLTVLLCVIALIEAPFVAMWLFHYRAEVPRSAMSSSGTVYVESEPAGLEVMANGRLAGRTPARLSLPRGNVELQLRHDGSVRVLPLVVNPGETMRLRVEFPAPARSIRPSASLVVAPSPVASVPAEQAGSVARASQLLLP